MDATAYLMYADARFMREELCEISDACSCKARLVEQMSPYLSVIRIDRQGTDDVLRSIRASTPRFVENVMPIACIINGEDLGKVQETLSERLSKGSTFRIEVIRFRSSVGQRAKDIEVSLGTHLESQGFVADLAKPVQLVSLVFYSGNVVVSIANSELLLETVMDHFRSENMSLKRISRAEIKIKEAFEAFELKERKFERCLDVGAAPGGWTGFLVRRGAKVVAIDAGALDYKRLGTEKIAIIEQKEGKYLFEPYFPKDTMPDLQNSEFDVVHIKSTAVPISQMPFELGIFDLLAIDVNTEQESSFGAATLYARLLKRGGILLMTIKLFSFAQPKDMAASVGKLSGLYSDIKIKKLPHNRMELTLCASRA